MRRVLPWVAYLVCLSTVVAASEPSLPTGDATVLPAWTTQDVIDPRIDEHAQYALMRMLTKGGGSGGYDNRGKGGGQGQPGSQNQGGCVPEPRCDARAATPFQKQLATCSREGNRCSGLCFLSPNPAGFGACQIQCNIKLSFCQLDAERATGCCVVLGTRTP